MTGAILFLQHARACCKAHLLYKNNCEGCPMNINSHCFLHEITYITNEQIADIVRAVEKWYVEDRLEDEHLIEEFDKERMTILEGGDVVELA